MRCRRTTAQCPPHRECFAEVSCIPGPRREDVGSAPDDCGCERSQRAPGDYQRDPACTPELERDVERVLHLLDRPSAPSPTALPFVVEDVRIERLGHAPAAEPCAPAQVGVFPIEEDRFVESAYVLPGSTGHHHCAAGNAGQLDTPDDTAPRPPTWPEDFRGENAELRIFVEARDHHLEPVLGEDDVWVEEDDVLSARL